MQTAWWVCVYGQEIVIDDTTHSTSFHFDYTCAVDSPYYLLLLSLLRRHATLRLSLAVPARQVTNSCDAAVTTVPPECDFFSRNHQPTPSRLYVFYFLITNLQIFNVDEACSFKNGP